MLYADWWVYEWCHRKKLSQFHSVMVQTKDTVENGKVVQKGSVQMKRDPDWSLGSFSRSLVVRVGADPYNTSAPILKVIDKYENGQPCDETGGVGRKTDVHLMCCEKDSIEKLNAQSPKDRNAIARIKSIVEPETCVYEMFICVQMLCSPDKSNKQLQPPNSKSRNDKMQQEDKLPLSKFLHSFQTLCLSKGEAWWTYEVCFGKNVRQVHYAFVLMKVTLISMNLHCYVLLIYNSFLFFVLNNSMLIHCKDEKGGTRQTQHAEAEFDLGSLPPPEGRTPTVPTKSPPVNDMKLVEGMNIIKINARTNTTHSETSGKELSEEQKQVHRMIESFGRDNEMDTKPGLQIEYTNGTPCTVSDGSADSSEFDKRSTTVIVYCDKQDGIISIQEDRTCHYTIKSTSSHLCKVSGFELEEIKFMRVNFEYSQPINPSIATE